MSVSADKPRPSAMSINDVDVSNLEDSNDLGDEERPGRKPTVNFPGNAPDM